MCKVRYEKEYDEGFFKIQKHQIKQGNRVVIVDIITTSDSAKALEKLLTLCGRVVEFCFLTGLTF
jgi:adenine/guanine phosphoribosyltransferase-like PRPP-binding protein